MNEEISKVRTKIQFTELTQFTELNNNILYHSKHFELNLINTNSNLDILCTDYDGTSVLITIYKEHECQTILIINTYERPFKYYRIIENKLPENLFNNVITKILKELETIIIY